MLLYKDCDPNLKRAILLEEYEKQAASEAAITAAVQAVDPDSILREYFGYKDDTEVVEQKKV